MRRVAGQERPALAPARRRPRVEGVDDGPLDARLLAAEPGRDPLAQCAQGRGTAPGPRRGAASTPSGGGPATSAARRSAAASRRRSGDARPWPAAGRRGRRPRASAGERSSRRTRSRAAAEPGCRRRRSRPASALARSPAARRPGSRAAPRRRPRPGRTGPGAGPISARTDSCSARAATRVRSSEGWWIETIGGCPCEPSTGRSRVRARPAAVTKLTSSCAWESARTSRSTPAAWKMRRTSSSTTAARGRSNGSLAWSIASTETPARPSRRARSCPTGPSPQIRTS